MKQLYMLFLALFISATSFGQVVISQVYGGGGNSGATLKQDFVELFNHGTSAVDLSTYSLQYASSAGPSTGNSWATQFITGTIQPNKYFLIQCASGTGGTVDLVPDSSPYVGGGSVGVTGIALSGTGGKIMLVNNQTAFGTVTCPLPNASIIDFVGFGTTANCYEGTGRAAAPSNTTSVMRTNNVDTNDNAADFTAVTPDPRNSSFVLSIGKDEIANFSLYPNPVKGGKVFINSANNYAERMVEVFDVLGKQVVSQKGTQSSVDVSHLNKGIYIIKVAEEGKVATRKLVIE